MVEIICEQMGKKYLSILADKNDVFSENFTNKQYYLLPLKKNLSFSIPK